MPSGLSKSDLAKSKTLKATYIGVGIAIIVVIIVLVVVMMHKKSVSMTSFAGDAETDYQAATAYVPREYVIIPANQPSTKTGAYSADTSPIMCDGSASDSICLTDPATAGQVCDMNPTCIGLIYDVSNAGTQLATPIQTTPYGWAGTAPTFTYTDGTTTQFYGSVVMSPVAAGTAPPAGSWSMLPSVPANTSWVTGQGNPSLGAMILPWIIANSKQSSGQGAIIPAAGSAWQLNAAGNPYLTGQPYTTIAPATSAPAFQVFQIN